MGLILDSSVVIAAERRGDNVAKLLKQIFAATADQETALSAIGLTELIHGIYRAQTTATRARRESFIQELLTDIDVIPYTKRHSASSRQARRRTAEPRRGYSVRRSAYWSDRRLERLFRAHRERSTLSLDPRPIGDSTLGYLTLAGKDA